MLSETIRLGEARGDCQARYWQDNAAAYAELTAALPGREKAARPARFSALRLYSPGGLLSFTGAQNKSAPTKGLPKLTGSGKLDASQSIPAGRRSLADLFKS